MTTSPTDRTPLRPEGPTINTTISRLDRGGPAQISRSARRRTRAVQGASQPCALGVGVVPRWCTRGKAAISGEARPSEAGESVKQLVLEAPVVDRRVRLDAALMVPVGTGGAGVGVVARGQPLLGEVPEP
jgi:hypothetical protein